MEPGTAVTPLRRNRDFLVLWSGQAVSALGNSMSTLVFPLVGYAITGSTVQAGLAATAVLVGRVVARLPVGALADRWSRRRTLVVADVLGAALYGSLAAALLAHHLTLAHLVAVGFLSGVANSFVAPASSAALRTVVPQPQLPAALSAVQARQHAAEIVGPPAGGALYSVARGLPFLFDAVTYAASALAIRRLRAPLPAPQPSAARRSVRADVAEGLRFVWRHNVIRAMMLWGGIINFSVHLVLVVVTLRLVRAGVAPAAIGLVDTIASAAGLLGALAAPAVVARTRTGVMTVVTGLTLSVVVLPMVWTDDVVPIGALLAVGFLLLPANNAGIGAYMTAVTPDRLQGRVNAAGGLIANGIQPLAPALAGVLLGTVGDVPATVFGAVCVAAGVVPLLSSRPVRNLGRPVAWSTPDRTAQPETP